MPKPVPAELGVKASDHPSLTLEQGRVVLRAHPRAGWAEAAKELAAAGDDGLVWPEFGNYEEPVVRRGGKFRRPLANTKLLQDEVAGAPGAAMWPKPISRRRTPD